VTAAFKIVLNYRRDDAAGHAGHLYEDLVERFGDGNVFMDIDAMEPGVDFPKVIEGAVGSCDAFVAMIGQRWLSATDAKGRPRLENPKDFVRLEIEAALWREVRLIPVLVQDAEMPSPDDLPESLAPLAHKHAHEIRDSSRRYDVDRLIEALERVAAEKHGQIAPPPPPPPPWWKQLPLSPKALIAVAAALVVALAVVGAVLLLVDGEDADRIAFAAQGRIYTIGADGKGEKDVTSMRSDDGSPDWSPNGKRLAVARSGRIWVLEASGKNARALTSGSKDGSPDWSPSGEQIAFSRPESPGSARYDVWMVDVESGTQRNLTNRRGETGAVPDWSPTGDEIVYQRRAKVWLMRADGEDQRVLRLAVPGSAQRPSWSPTRREIAVAIFQDKTTSDIYILDPDSGAIANVTDGRFRAPNAPTWSPDGDRIAFAAADGIWVVNRDRTEPQLVAPGRGNENPSWRPSSEG
jgi:WD40 repeat protein